MMCSLFRPPSLLLFSLLCCFHSHSSAGCTASTIQCSQTSSPQTLVLCRPLLWWSKGTGAASQRHRTPSSPGALWQNLKPFRQKRPGRESEVWQKPTNFISLCFSLSLINLINHSIQSNNPMLWHECLLKQLVFVSPAMSFPLWFLLQLWQLVMMKTMANFSI